MKIDEIDVLILAELQKDSRLSIRELSRRVNLSSPSVAERIRKMEDYGVIKGYTVKIDYEALGFPISCIVKITMRNGQYEQFQAFIQKHERSISGYRVAGEACFLVLLTVKSMTEIEAFINEIAPIAVSSTNFIFSSLDIDESISKFFQE